MLDVSVVIPTYKTRNTIFKLLDSLEKQSYKNFSVMVVYKKWEGYKEVLNAIKAYNKLDMDFVEQDKGYFEEALNTIYRKADGEVVIHTDDDAYASRNWVKDHVELHKRHKKIGLATGLVDESIYPDGTKVPFLKRFVRSQQWRMNKHTIIDKPIDTNFKDYGAYIGKSGMLVDTGRKSNMIKTFKQHGVNMSWKRDALHWFKLPGYTKNGIRNESAAALEAFNRSFETIWFGSATVYHPVQKSISRGTTIRSIPAELIVESVLFAYYVNRYAGYRVDLAVLKRRTKIDSVVSKIFKLEIRGYELGYQITKRAIEQDWSPKKVRSALVTVLPKHR